MKALLAVNITLGLFTPLLIGAGLALFVFLLGRYIASRKLARALDDDDDLVEPFFQSDSPRASDYGDSGSAYLEGRGDSDSVPSSIEFIRTREYVRARAAKKKPEPIEDPDDVITQVRRVCFEPNGRVIPG